MIKQLTYVFLLGAGYLLSSLLLSACSQAEELTDTEKIELEKPEIEEYVAAEGLTGLFNFQGVYVVTEFEGDTATSLATSSSFVDLAYTGSFLSGVVFENTGTEGIRTSAGELPQLSALIPGLESGIKLFRKGGKGTLIIPSPLAYEEYGSTDGRIPPNAILRFDFTLLDVQ